MTKYLCKAKRIFDGKWVVGYYVALPWEDTGETAHLIIDVNGKYKCHGSFTWNSIHRVYPDTVEFVINGGVNNER